MPGHDVQPYRNQFGLAPENFTTFAHFSVSAAMKLPNSARDKRMTVPPMSARRFCVLASPRVVLIATLSLLRVAAGVFRGAPTPDHRLASYPRTTSPTVG